MNDIDQVSKALGRLQAEAESSHNQRVEIFKKLDGLTVQTTAMVSSVNQLLDVVGKHEKELKGLNAFKNRTLGYAAAIGTGAGAIGSYLSKIVNHQ